MVRNIATAAVVILAGLVQLTYPAVLAPWQVVPDVVLLFVLAMALYYRPSQAMLWWAGLAGLVVDLWQPSHFGSWTLACLVVAAVAIVVNTRLLPRFTQPGAWVTGLISLAAGLAVLAAANALGAPLGASLAALGRLYLPKLILDLALAVPLLALVKRLAVALRLQPAGPGGGSAGSGTRIVVNV